MKADHKKKTEAVAAAKQALRDLLKKWKVIENNRLPKGSELEFTGSCKCACGKTDGVAAGVYHQCKWYSTPYISWCRHCGN